MMTTRNGKTLALTAPLLMALGTLPACDDDSSATPGMTTPDGSSGSADAAAAGDGAVTDGLAQPLASQDPAPALQMPGKYTIPAPCPGCPTSDDTVFEIMAGAVTQRTFSGTVTGAVGNGRFFVEALGTGAGVQRELWGPIPTQSNGAFSFNAPLFCGEQLVKCVWSNAAGTYVLVTRVVTTNCVEPDLRVTLSWDELGRDWELHLIKPGGRINDRMTDCTWTTCLGGDLDWGVPGDPTDNPRKDVDNTGQYGPENIFLARPESGRYTVLVEHWGSGSPTSDGQVIINLRGRTYGFSVEDLPSRWVWNVATIDWPQGVVTGIGTRFDCTGSWSSGCTAMLP